MANHKIFFYCKEDGEVHVHPSPAIVRHKDEIRVWNLSGCKADVEFKMANVVDKDKFPIDNGASVDLKVKRDPGNTPVFYEYKVKLSKEGQSEKYAVGGSDPGVIIDP